MQTEGARVNFRIGRLAKCAQGTHNRIHFDALWEISPLWCSRRRRST
ncbi:hypothetical protein PPTG_02541 [Phytophthora nicotianae INRA-310]|uniref:Uncharacterized protein n=1 Tax=Phytophthora nicotianae (strain INRA-310) TaxID=761204 RepID=W2RDQ7_PHYN3|nr:hypothetical protein PPTG_02541 [Phytophthora nicotianae INRA-310]ETN22680.1 hypothetical protein PPTG_02541 [Phytophthora nicotianae INRA-310]